MKLISFQHISQLRFSSLNHQEKCLATLVNNSSFLLAFLKVYQNWNQKLLYNIYENRQIRNYLSEGHSKEPFEAILSKIRVAWFDEPLLYFQLEEEESQIFFRQLLDWMDLMSGQKVFEYAHKVKDKGQPEQNILWFNSQSYQQLPCWFANQIEKALIRSYFNKGNLNNDDLQRIKRLKPVIKSIKYDRKQSRKDNDEIMKLLAMKLDEAKAKKDEDFQTYQQKLKVYEDQYYEQVSLLIDTQEIQQKKLKKRKSKKRKNKKKVILQNNEEQEDLKAQEIKEEAKVQEKEPEKQQQQKEDKVQVKEEEEKKQNETQKGQEGKSSESYCSGYSQPQLRECSSKLTTLKRSLSPDNPLKKQAKNDKKTKITRGQDLSELDEFGSQKYETMEEFEQYIQETSIKNIQGNKRKRKRKNNKSNIIKDLSKKLGDSLICRQLNNFIDALSIETNNLYDHKIVAFERIRFFVQSLFPTVQTALFGSNAVGLSLPTSDIDILLFDLPCYSKEQASQILAHLAIQINAMGWIVSCSAYLNAKVPLIKLELDPSINYFETKRKCDYMGMIGIDPNYLSHLELPQNGKKDKVTQKSIKVDLTVNLNDCNFGSQSTQLMKSWMNEYPQLHRIILAFKYVLARKGFNSNFKGGIGSYCLFVMITAYMKENETSEKDQGELFMNILKFYGEQFDNHLKSITLTTQGPCFLSHEETLERLNNISDQGHQKDMMENLLRIFDPINKRIMSGSCFLYNNIKSEFRRIYNELLQAKQVLGKEVQISYNVNEATKVLQNKKSMQKWLNKYEIRSQFSMNQILN